MKKLNICIPCAGEGSRFRKEGYTDPKPFINVIDKWMILWVLNNFSIRNRVCHFIFICRDEHLQSYDFDSKLKQYFEGTLNTWEIVTVKTLTDGALCSVLKSRKSINNEDGLLITNSDQFLLWDPNNFIELIDKTDCDASTVTSFSNHPKWSYVSLDQDGYVIQSKEKEVISNICNVGVFYFKHGKDFVEAADDLIHRNERVGGEFYVAPSMNFIVKMGGKILNYPISNQAFLPMGIPEDLNRFVTFMSKFYEDDVEMARRLM